VESAVQARIPGVLSYAKAFRPTGEGELHVWRGSDRVRDDAMVEMLLLAKSSALIRYPPGSFFTLYAAVMKPRPSSMVQTLYDLQRPYDPDDPLSPALLI
jgi:Nodulation protein Z (NodZ)